MKTTKTKNLTFHTKKAFCTLLAPCLLLASCGQGSSRESSSFVPETTITPANGQEANTPVPITTPCCTDTPALHPADVPTPDFTDIPTPSPMEVPAPDSTDIPTPYSMDTPASMAAAEPSMAATPAPTQIPCVTKGAYWSDEVVYSTTEKDGETQTRLARFKISDELLSALSYREDQYPQLYARYQGTFRGTLSLRYVIDFIQVEDFNFPSKHPVILSIRLYGRHSDITDDNLVQAMEMSIDSYYLDAPQAVVLTDLNGDGEDDFIIDLGISTTGRSSYSLFFVCVPETGQYKLLDGFVNATFYKDEMLIYESNQNGSYHYFNKYSVEGSSLILQETIRGDGSFYGSGEMAYTLKKRVDGKWVTIKDCVPKDQIDFSSWHTGDWNNRVK